MVEILLPNKCLSGCNTSVRSNFVRCHSKAILDHQKMTNAIEDETTRLIETASYFGSLPTLGCLDWEREC